MTTVNIRCGSDIREGLLLAGIDGEFLDFSDPFCQGPVKETERADLLETRLRFVIDAYGTDPIEGKSKITAAYDGLASALDAGEVTLWFEHDTYDQLILAFILAFFREKKASMPIKLVCVDDYPVEPRFIGLGQLAPEALRDVWDKREAVTEAHLQQGEVFWQALVSSSPECMADFALGTEDCPIPQMRGAARRHLQQLPHESSGLSLTEELSLKALQDGPLTGGKLYRRLTLEDEPLPYLGDLMYWHELAPLLEGGAISTDAPELEWRERPLQLTELGHDVLAGKADWLDHVSETRWVGGIEIVPQSKAWRRCTDDGYRLM